MASMADPCSFRNPKSQDLGFNSAPIEGRVAPLHVLQPPYNLFERAIEAEILPYCRKHGIATFGYGALCRGLLSGRMRRDTTFAGDDLRRSDPKFLAQIGRASCRERV